jgi:CMP-N-acetylneuraminic acid synthetase
MKIAFISMGAHTSTRLPFKNHKILNGKEVCRYTFDFMKDIRYPYYVLTESEVIKRIAKEYKYKIIECDREFRDGIEGMKRVHNIIKADAYFIMSFTSPIRDLINIKRNIKLCIESKINFAYSGYIDIKTGNAKATGSMYYLKKEYLYLNKWRSKDSIILPDYYDFDIDTQEDFDRVENYLKGK